MVDDFDELMDLAQQEPIGHELRWVFPLENPFGQARSREEHVMLTIRAYTARAVVKAA